MTVSYLFRQTATATLAIIPPTLAGGGAVKAPPPYAIVEHVEPATALDPNTIPLVEHFLNLIEYQTAANTPSGNLFRSVAEQLGGELHVGALVMDRVPASALLKRLEAFHALTNGWDGDDAPAPTENAITRARRLVDLIGRFPDEIDPDAVGGIAVWFYLDSGAKLMLGLRNSGAAVICSYAAGAPLPSVTCVGDDESLLQTIGQSFAELA